MKRKIHLLAAVFLQHSPHFPKSMVLVASLMLTNMLTSYLDPGTQLIYAIGAVVGLIGGIKVYNKFSSRDPDTGKTAASCFGACIFLIVAATILRSFFL